MSEGICLDDQLSDFSIKLCITFSNKIMVRGIFL